MYTEGACFVLGLIADEIKVSFLMVVLYLGGVVGQFTLLNTSSRFIFCVIRTILICPL